MSHDVDTAASPVPIWVPNPNDPDGLDGTWQIVDPATDPLDPERAAQASAVAALWAWCGRRRRNVA